MISNSIYQTYINKITIFLLLLIIFSFDYKKSDKINTPLAKKYKTHTSFIIHNYKLYNATDYALISVILDFSNISSLFLNNTLIEFLLNLSEYKFFDKQIILLQNLSIDIIQDKTIKLLLKEKRLEIHPLVKNNWIKNFFDIFNEIRGKFFILLDEILDIKDDIFHKIYNITKGSKENIFKLEFLGKDKIYLIRTKVLKDIIDSEITFKDFKEIINYIYEQSIHKFNYIPIIFCPDNYYTSLTYTSMISILISKDYYTYILFYLIIPLGFSKKNIQFIESLYEQFDYFNITFIQMDNRYKRAYTKRYLTKNAFFRLSLGEILPKMDKVIYLDSDTICLKDLSNLYNLNFLGKIFIAKINTFTSGNNFTVNTGVLLLNLKAMRKIKVEEKTLMLLNNGFKDPSFHDQAIINKFFKKYIGFLPPEYNTYTFNYKIIQKYKEDSGRLYDFDSLYFSFKFPSIIHYRGDPKTKNYNEEDWYYFARKSKYFQKRSHNLTEIFNFTI